MEDKEIFIKFIGINLSLCYSFLKIINFPKVSKTTIFILFICSIISAFIQTLLSFSFIFELIIIILVYTVIFSKIVNIKFEDSFIITSISISISFIMFVISSIISLLLLSKVINIYYRSIVVIICISVLNFIFVYLLFKLKRIKNGFPFLQNRYENSYLSMFILLINSFIIFIYLLIGDFTNIPIQQLFLGFILFVIIMIIVIQKTFILYQKQKLQTKTLKEYEKELKETKQKLETALEEKEKLVKSNHEFYHRQEALKNKLDNLINQKQNEFNSEFSEELCRDIMDRINNLSNEYVQKMHATPKLIKTGIEEIDDMLEYMQSECEKNNIEFILQVDCDINYIIENFITKSQLETLLGDLIRNAIIAINHSTYKFRSIMVVFGIKDDSYELCILDSGIPFEIITLLNLGLHPATTHKSEGGTGMGFITTFETINSCNASFIINENTNNNYTKSIEIKFDNKHEYVIISNRSENIKKMNVVRRNIVLKNE